MQAKVVANVNQFYSSRNVICLHKLFGFAVTGAEKQYIDIEVMRSGKCLIRIAQQIGMYLMQRIAGIATALHKAQFYLRMVDEQTNQFAPRISCTTNNACSDFHDCIF